MVPWLEVMEPYIYVFLMKVTVRRYGTMQLVALWSQVKLTAFPLHCVGSLDFLVF